MEIAGRIGGADISTQTQGIMQAATFASEIIKSIPRSQRAKATRSAQNKIGMTLDEANTVLTQLGKSRDENPEGHLILASNEGYAVRLDTDRNCFLRPINEHYVVSAIGMVKRKLEPQDPPIPLMPENVKPIRPFIEQLDQAWANVYENTPLLKELQGPCLIVTPVCIH